jgi:hypothetical protein
MVCSMHRCYPRLPLNTLACIAGDSSLHGTAQTPTLVGNNSPTWPGMSKGPSQQRTANKTGHKLRMTSRAPTGRPANHGTLSGALQ